MATLSHCHPRISRKSGGHGQVTQFGRLSPGAPPGQPLKVVTTSTPSLLARRTAFLNSASCAAAIFLFGCKGFPWQESDDSFNPREVISSIHALASLLSAS